MNLLAHALIANATLTDTNGQEVTGALMADYFSGQDLADYPQGIRSGIEQHRAVDAFTDYHPVFMSCRAAVAMEGAPRFTSGILTDIFWDHVLASEWETWGRRSSGMHLGQFCDTVYEKLARAKSWHSPAFSQAYAWIAGQSWMATYADLEGIERTLTGISLRMSGQIHLGDCTGILQRLDRTLRHGFAAFWPELLAFSRDWARSHPVPVEASVGEQ